MVSIKVIILFSWARMCISTKISCLLDQLHDDKQKGCYVSCVAGERDDGQGARGNKRFRSSSRAGSRKFIFQQTY